MAYNPDDEQKVLQDYNEYYDEAIQDWSVYLSEAHKDLAFFVGNQWSSADKGFLQQEGRNAYVFNNIRRIIKQITGYQRKNRLSSICSPVEPNDQEVSDVMTDVLLYVMNRSGGYNVLSDAFEGALVTGFNLISLYMDYSADPVNGDIKICREPFNSFIIDPNFSKLDLSDCRYIIRRRYVDKDTVKLLLPGKEKEIDELSPSSGKDGKFGYMSYSMKSNTKGLYRYDEFWRRVTKKGYMLIDQETGQTRKWKGKKKQLDEFLAQYPNITVQTIYEPSVEMHVILEDKVMLTSDDSYGVNDYPFVAVIGNYSPEYDDYQYKLQGVVRGLRDAQEELNKLRSKASDIITSQVNSGWIVKEGSVKNPKDLFKTGQGVVIETSRNAMPGDVAKIQPAELSQGISLMISALQSDIMTLAGSSEELMGSAEGGNTEVSGTLSAQRAANSLVTLQSLFDNLNFAQQQLSKKIINMILANWNEAKVSRITNREIPQGIMGNIDIGQYDIQCKQATLTESQRTLEYMQLLEAQRVGVQIPQRALLRALPITNKSELMKDFEAEQQAAQEQQQKIAEQEALALRLGNASVASQLSLSTEREARAKADVGLLIERTSESVVNQSQGVLNQVRAASEIMGMRQDQLMSAIQFVMGLNEQANIKDKTRELTSSIEAEMPSSEAQQSAQPQQPQQPQQMM